MEATVRRRSGIGQRAASLSALLVFVLGTQHCAFMGLSGRSCDSPSHAALAPTTAHSCCAGKAARSPVRSAPEGGSSCCLQPAPLPAVNDLPAPALAALSPATLATATLPSPAADVRRMAPAGDDESPPGAPTPGRSLGRAPPLA